MTAHLTRRLGITFAVAALAVGAGGQAAHAATPPPPADMHVLVNQLEALDATADQGRPAGLDTVRQYLRPIGGIGPWV